MRMRWAAGGVTAAAAAVGMFAALTAGQATQPRPGPGRDVVPIEGTVTVANIPSVAVSNTPTVLAAQSGSWRVAVTALPPVRLAALSFLKEGQKYRFTWPSGQQDELTVRSAVDGWVLGDGAEAGGRVSRWINPAMAVTIETR